MAIKTSLRLIARRIAEAVGRSTAALGMLPQDYALVGSFDPNIDRISLILGIGRAIDDRRLYAETLQEIRRSFPGNPTITMLIGLVIRQVPKLDEIYWDSVMKDDEIDLTETFERFHT